MSDGKRGRVRAMMMREEERREGQVLTGRKSVYLSAHMPHF